MNISLSRGNPCKKAFLKSMLLHFQPFEAHNESRSLKPNLLPVGESDLISSASSSLSPRATNLALVLMLPGVPFSTITHEHGIIRFF